MERLNRETIPMTQATIEIEPDFEGFIPQEFKDDPIGYFEREGKNIKSGEKRLDKHGKIEDPGATKDLPAWHDNTGTTIETVGKLVNIEKIKRLAESEDPFFEYRVLELAQKLDLPAAKPIVKVSQNEDHLIVMSKIPGYRWESEADKQLLKEAGFTEEEIPTITAQAEILMQQLKEQFEQAGIKRRKWQIKDMVLDIDLTTKRLIGLTPVDWERTDVDWDMVGS